MENKSAPTLPPPLSAGSPLRGWEESNPWVWVTVDRQRDNSAANTIIDSHLCPPLQIRQDYKRDEMGFSLISFCRWNKKKKRRRKHTVTGQVWLYPGVQL